MLSIAGRMSQGGKCRPGRSPYQVGELAGQWRPAGVPFGGYRYGYASAGSSGIRAEHADLCHGPRDHREQARGHGVDTGRGSPWPVRGDLTSHRRIPFRARHGSTSTLLGSRSVASPRRASNPFGSVASPACKTNVSSASAVITPLGRPRASMHVRGHKEVPTDSRSRSPFLAS